MRETGSCCTVAQRELWLHKATWATFSVQNLSCQDKSWSLQKLLQPLAACQLVAPCNYIYNPVAYSTVLVLVYLSSIGVCNGRVVASTISTVSFHIRLFQTVSPAFGADGHHPEGPVLSRSNAAIQICYCGIQTVETLHS